MGLVTHSGEMGTTEQNWGAQAHRDMGQERVQGRGLAEASTQRYVWVLLLDSVAGMVSGGRDTQKNSQWRSKLCRSVIDQWASFQ